MNDQNPYSVGTAVVGSPPPERRLVTSENLEYAGKRVRCWSPAVLPRICVLTGTTDDLVMLTRRLTRQGQIHIWGPATFAPFCLVGLWAEVGSGTRSPVLGLIEVSFLLWPPIQRFVVPLFVRSCSVTYFIQRDQLRRRHWIGTLALAAPFLFGMMSLLLFALIGRSETGLLLGLLFAISLSVADRAFTGPVRLALAGRRGRDVLVGFKEPFMKIAKKHQLS